MRVLEQAATSRDPNQQDVHLQPVRYISSVRERKKFCLMGHVQCTVVINSLSKVNCCQSFSTSNFFFNSRIPTKKFLVKADIGAYHSEQDHFTHYTFSLCTATHTSLKVKIFKTNF